MPSTFLTACLALLTLVLPALSQAPKTVLQGKEAIDEIGIFMNSRWHRQAWRIDFRSIDPGQQAQPVWHVAGTSAWARLDGPDHLKEHCDLSKLDPKSVYEIVGVPVDQNYGAITFYILSPPEKVATETPKKAGNDTSDEAPTPPSSKPVAKLSEQDASCLAVACRITTLMNDGKWDEVENALGTKEGMIAALKLDAAHNDWPGIGAYRGFRIDREAPREIVFRFGFAPKSNPHEIWISFTGGNPSKPGLMVLGW